MLGADNTFCPDIAYALAQSINSGAYICRAVNRLDALIGALDRSVRDRLTRPEAGIMFSGGVDSCVIARLASGHALVKLYTVGVDGAHDLKVGESSSLAMGLTWEGIIITDSDIREAIPFVAKHMGTVSPLALSFEMPLFFVARAAEEEIDSLRTGSGRAVRGICPVREHVPCGTKGPHEGGCRRAHCQGSSCGTSSGLGPGQGTRAPIPGPKHGGVGWFVTG